MSVVEGSGVRVRGFSIRFLPLLCDLQGACGFDVRFWSISMVWSFSPRSLGAAYEIPCRTWCRALYLGLAVFVLF